MKKRVDRLYRKAEVSKMGSIGNNSEFYKGKRVLVTGHTGFKGAWLCEMLTYFGAEVLGYALHEEEGSLYSKIRDDISIDNVYGDINDFTKFSADIQEFKPEIVFHLAAFGFIKECYDNPVRAYNTNVMGTVSLMESIRQCSSVKSVVVVTTDKVYENHGDGAVYSEDDRLGGVGPYSSSKTCCEFVVNDYRTTYFEAEERKIGIATVRASNVLGGGDHIESRLIPTILRSIDKGEEVPLRHPEQTRPWQSVLDALNGYMTVARRLYYEPNEYSRSWNIGPTEDGIKSVGWVYEKIKEYFADMKSINTKEIGIGESRTLGLDISNSVEALGWKPCLSTEEIIRMLVDFYKNQKNGISSHDICVQQIQYFVEND